MDSVSIEETNRIRVALGLKPLPVPGAAAPSGPVFKESAKDGNSDDELASTLESRSAQGFDNWKKLEEEKKSKAQRDAKKEAIKKARDKAERFKKLEGKGLGDEEDSGELDTKTWLMQQKKRQKKIEKARKLEQELADREAQIERERQYTATDLAGVKVAHELSQLDDGAEHILTLADREIGQDDDDGEEEDQLEASDLRDKEKTHERLESKKRKRVYDPNDVDDDGNQTLLAQYDDKEKKTFTLDGQGRTKEEAEVTANGLSANKGRVKISLDLLADEAPISDYVDPSEIKVRKPKKKKTKSSKRRVVDEEDMFPVQDDNATEDGPALDLDNSYGVARSSNLKKPAMEDDFVDDEDLQANLAIQRRAALKKRKRMRPEDIARQLLDESATTPDAMEVIETTEDEPGLVIDETSEFVAGLQKEEIEERQRGKAVQMPQSTSRRKSDSPYRDAEGDTEMVQSYAEVEDDEEDSSRLERGTSTTEDITATGLEEEATLNQGLGSTLSMLTQRGLLKTTSEGDMNAYWRERQRFLADKQKAESEADKKARLQRERDRQSGRLDHMSTIEREEYARHVNSQRDQLESRKMAEIFNKEYKPNVELKYVDEFGRYMNQKEAFKELSHQFHGKGSGKQKTEKRLKKIADEKKREAMSSLDSSQHTGMNSAMGATAKKNRQPGVRLQ